MSGKRKSSDKESDKRDSKQVRRHGSSLPSPCTLAPPTSDQGLAFLLCEGYLTYRVDGSREKSRVRGCYPGCQEEAVCNFFRECICAYFAPLVWRLFCEPPLAIPTEAEIDLGQIMMHGGYHSCSYSADELKNHDGLVIVAKCVADLIWTDPDEQAGFGISLFWSAFTIGDHLSQESRDLIIATMNRMKHEGHERLRLDFRVIRYRVGCFVVGGDRVIETIRGSDGILCDLRETSSWGPHPPQEDPPQEEGQVADPVEHVPCSHLGHIEVHCEDAVSCDERHCEAHADRPGGCKAHNLPVPPPPPADLPVPPPPPPDCLPLPSMARTRLPANMMMDQPPGMFGSPMSLYHSCVIRPS